MQHCMSYSCSGRRGSATILPQIRCSLCAGNCVWQLESGYVRVNAWEHVHQLDLFPSYKNESPFAHHQPCIKTRWVLISPLSFYHHWFFSPPLYICNEENYHLQSFTTISFSSHSSTFQMVTNFAFISFLPPVFF